MMKSYYTIVLRLLLIVFVITLFLSCGNCYALSSDDVIDYINNTADYFSSNNNYQYIKSNSHKNYVVNFINQYSSSFNNFACFKDGSYVEYKFFNASNGKITGYTDGLFYSGIYTAMLCDNSSVIWTLTNQSQTNSSIDGGKSYKSTVNQENTLLGMSYITQEITGTTPNTWVGDQGLIPPFSFTTNLDSVTYNGLSGYSLPFSYNETLSYLGTLEGIPEGTHYIGVSFSSVGSYGTVLRDIKNLYTNENSSTNLIIDNNYNIYVKNRYLNYNTQYSLFVDCYSDSTYEVVTGSVSTYIVAVAPGTQVSGGIITSLGSGEPYSTQNSTNDIISNITNYTPVQSGDLISGIVAYDPYSYSGDVNFFNDILQHVSQIFLDDNVHYIDIPIPMTTSVYRLYNNYWVTYNYLPELAIFISSAWWFLIFYIVIKKWSFVVDLIKVGDFRGSYQRNISIKEDFVDARCDNEFCLFNIKCNC